MIVYIRHANDKEHNPQYLHDTHITDSGKKDARKATAKLVKKYGFPDKIYYSPFLRCKETLEAMISELRFIQTGVNKKCCVKCYKGVELIIDNDLSRCFNYDKNKPSVSPKTLKNHVPIKETDVDLHSRIDNHIKNVDRTKNVWCLTHAIIYKKIAKKLNIVTPDKIEFLDHFVYK